MQVKLEGNRKNFDKADLKVIGGFQKKDKKGKKTVAFSAVDKELLNHIEIAKSFENFTADKGEYASFTGPHGESIY
jgi:hypothetical protein